ncbi:hypothetical protein HDU85_007389 [Gaertneriomyces sp. JEL0708]|nr:hypothetical protein HDU85_007389 [Gaertneriomyces sp. JEL0708]
MLTTTTTTTEEMAPASTITTTTAPAAAAPNHHKTAHFHIGAPTTLNSRPFTADFGEALMADMSQDSRESSTPTVPKAAEPGPAPSSSSSLPSLSPSSLPKRAAAKIPETVNSARAIVERGGQKVYSGTTLLVGTSLGTARALAFAYVNGIRAVAFVAAASVIMAIKLYLQVCMGVLDRVARLAAAISTRLQAVHTAVKGTVTGVPVVGAGYNYVSSVGGNALDLVRRVYCGVLAIGDNGVQRVAGKESAWWGQAGSAWHRITMRPHDH